MHSFSHKIRSSAALSALLFFPGFGPSLLFAEEVVELDPFAVRGGPLSLTQPGVELAQAEAARFAGGMAVISAEAAQAGRAATVAETLAGVPGVFAQSRFGPLDTRLSIRGSGIVRTGHGKGVQLRYGLIPVNQADGNFDVHALDIFGVSHIVVRRGGNAFATGNTTLGGSIDYIPLTGHTAPAARVRVEAGSFDTFSANASAAYQEGAFDAFASIGYAESDGFRDHSQFSARRASANVGWRVSETTEVRALVSYTDARSKWPGALTEAQFQENPRQAATIARQRGQGLDIEQVLLGLQMATTLAGGLTLEAGVGFNYKHEDHPTPGAILDLRTHDLTLDLRLSGEAGDNLRWRVGVRPGKGTGRELRFAYAGPPTSAVASERGNLNLAVDRTARNFVGFAHIEYDLTDDLTLDAGLQAVESMRQIGDRPGGAPSPDYRFTYSGINPRLGALYSIAPGLRAFAAFTTSREAPTFFDFAGNAGLQPDRIPDLRQQRAHTVEAGLRGAGPTLRWEALAYESSVRNELLVLDPAAGFGSPIVNAPRVRKRGIEASAHARFNLGGEWSLEPRLVYTGSYFSFRNHPEFGNNAYAGVPRHHFTGALEIAFREQWFLTPRIESAPSDRWVDNANTTRVSGFTVAHLRLAYRAPDGRWRLFADIRNLTDTRYSPVLNVVPRANPNTAIYFPADGRSLHVGLELSW